MKKLLVLILATLALTGCASRTGTAIVAGTTGLIIGNAMAHSTNWRGESLHDRNTRPENALPCCAWPSSVSLRCPSKSRETARAVLWARSCVSRCSSWRQPWCSCQCCTVCCTASTGTAISPDPAAARSAAVRWRFRQP